MTDEQYKALLDAVIESKEATNEVKRELARLRGDLARVESTVHAVRGDVIMLGVQVEILDADVAKVHSTLSAMMQTIDGMNHLAKSAYDMASSNVKALKTFETKLDEQASAKEGSG